VARAATVSNDGAMSPRSSRPIISKERSVASASWAWVSRRARRHWRRLVPNSSFSSKATLRLTISGGNGGGTGTGDAYLLKTGIHSKASLIGRKATIGVQRVHSVMLAERQVKRLLIVPALAVLLSGCGIAAKVNARHDMEASKVAYKACLAHHGPDVQACNGLRRAYEADLSAFGATSAALRSGTVYSYEAVSPASSGGTWAATGPGFAASGAGGVWSAAGPGFTGAGFSGPFP
jgi:hypothetical protein